jgi:hypothetical protein
MQTLFYIDDVMAMTHAVRQLTILVEPSSNGKSEYTWLPRGKRKPARVRLGPEWSILLEGDAPFRVDTECARMMSGNACFNFIGDVEVIRAALQDQSDDVKAKCLVWSEGRGAEAEPVIVFPDIQTHHAAINRHKEKQAV